MAMRILYRPAISAGWNRRRDSLEARTAASAYLSLEIIELDWDSVCLADSR